MKTIGFWCNVCDAKLVNSGDKSTGKFFTVSGLIDPASRDGVKRPGDDARVCFAVCPNCSPKDVLCEWSDNTEAE